MVHILVEDSGNGFQFCKIIKSLYFDENDIQVELETLGGIWKLKDKIYNKINSIKTDDIIIIVYDDVFENPIISRNIIETQEYIEDYNLSDRVLWLPTYSFEIELLLIVGFEFFANSERYIKYFWKLREGFIKTGNLAELTALSKNDGIYSDMYTYEKKKKQNVAVYRQLSRDDFERAITIETISKAIMTEVFRYESPLKRSDFVDKPLGGKDERNCWKNNCCNRKNRCKNSIIDIDTIIERQKTERLYKTKFLIFNTSYRKLIDKIYDIEGLSIDTHNITIGDFISKEMLEANYIHNLISI